MTAIFDALGNATRRHILRVLAGGECAVGDVVAALHPVRSISQPAVSQHLATLLDAGLVTVRADGRRRLYAVDHDGIATARSWLADLTDPLAGLAQPLDALETEVARGQRDRRRRTSTARRADERDGRTA